MEPRKNGLEFAYISRRSWLLQFRVPNVSRLAFSIAFVFLMVSVSIRNLYALLNKLTMPLAETPPYSLRVFSMQIQDLDLLAQDPEVPRQWSEKA